MTVYGRMEKRQSEQVGSSAAGADGLLPTSYTKLLLHLLHQTPPNQTLPFQGEQNLIETNMNHGGADERSSSLFSSPTHIFILAELAKEANFAVLFKLKIPSNNHLEPEDLSVEIGVVF